MRKIQLNTVIIPILCITSILIGACGKSLPPKPLYQNQSTQIQKEIQTRKDKNIKETEKK